MCPEVETLWFHHFGDNGTSLSIATEVGIISKPKKKKIGHGVQAPETHGQAAEFKEKKRRKHN